MAFIMRVLTTNRILLSDIWTRGQEVGTLSLSALLVGGSILNLFSVNILTSRDTYQHDAVTQSTLSVFRVASQLGVQPWLAILGVAFGLLSFGMKASYTHIFDCWSTLKANKSPGLNYARYLNSQPNSPVMFGVRGFPTAVLLRNLIIALGIVCSVGYNFAVVKVTVETYQSLDQSAVLLRVPPIPGLLVGGIASPWLSDGPLLKTNRAFLHRLHLHVDDIRIGTEDTNPAQRAPKRVVMVGWPDCHDLFNLADKGILYTREIVLVARKTKDPTTGGADYMTADHLGWMRAENSSSRWSTTGTPAVIDYRIAQSKKIEIQWAETGGWLHNGSERGPVIGRLTYELYLAVAMVRRFVSGRDCSGIYDEDGVALAAQVVMESDRPVTLDSGHGVLLQNKNWINTILLSDDSSPREGVGVLVRSVMACWGDSNGATLGHAPLTLPPRPTQSNQSETPDLAWFNEPDFSKSASQNISTLIFLDPLENEASLMARAQKTLPAMYPAYAGIRATGRTGSYRSVMGIFMSIGTFAYILVGVRMYLGPAELTSWMGQHIYLAGLGGKVPREKTQHLASGHQAANELELGRVRVKANEPLTKTDWLHMAMLAYYDSKYEYYREKSVSQRALSTSCVPVAPHEYKKALLL